MAATIDRIHHLWQWCYESYLLHANRKLAFQKDTDPTKTYQWRFLEALDRKLTEFGFDDKLSREFVDCAVKYASRHRLLDKGLSIFLQANLLKECYEQIRNNIKLNDDVLGIILHTKQWLDDRARGLDLTQLLMNRESIGSYTNIVKWYQAGQLPEQYIALSRACGITIIHLNKLDKPERINLPSDIQLFLTRSQILQNSHNKFKLRSILHDDWRSKCP